MAFYIRKKSLLVPNSMYKMYVTDIFPMFYIHEVISLANIAKIKCSSIKNGLQYVIKYDIEYSQMHACLQMLVKTNIPLLQLQVLIGFKKCSK